MRISSSSPVNIAKQDDDQCTVLFRDSEMRPSPDAYEEPLSRQHSLSSVLSNSDLDDCSSSVCLDTSNMSLPSSLLGTPLCSTPVAKATDSVPSSHDAQRSASTRRELSRTLAILHSYLKTEESPRYGFLGSVQEGSISALERAEVLLWLEELVQFHECDQSTFVCAAALLDQLLSKTKMKLRHLRIAAVACFLIAAKCLLDEADQPLLDDLVASVREFSSNDLRRMELVVLDKLQWCVPTKSTLDVLHNLAAYAAVEFQLDSTRVAQLTSAAVQKYVACTVSYELLRFKPSVVAASIIVAELCETTSFSEGFLRHIFQSELQIDAHSIDTCACFVTRHLRATAALFAGNKQ